DSTVKMYISPTVSSSNRKTPDRPVSAALVDPSPDDMVTRTLPRPLPSDVTARPETSDFDVAGPEMVTASPRKLAESSCPAESDRLLGVGSFPKLNVVAPDRASAATSNV